MTALDPTPFPPLTNPLRVLVVMPSWVGDAVMATPALRLLRERLRGSFLGALVRPGIDQVLAPSSFIDQFHVDRARGLMGPKHVASRLRPVRYDTALLLTNSFSTALITRLAFIPRRLGYDRDGRGLLLTHRVPPRRRSGALAGFEPVSAVRAYFDLVLAMFDQRTSEHSDAAFNAARLELATSPDDDRAAHDILARAWPAIPIVPDAPPVPFAILNPGGNDPAKRWPAERFVDVGLHLARRHGLQVLINGSPGERDLCALIAAGINQGAAPGVVAPGPVAASLPDLHITLGSLKALTRAARLMVTNDTGPRHIAAAFNTPCVALFGPTDPRWTVLPPNVPETRVVADPTLPPDQAADDHPERCRIDRIETPDVVAAVDAALASPRAR